MCSVDFRWVGLVVLVGVEGELSVVVDASRPRPPRSLRPPCPLFLLCLLLAFGVVVDGVEVDLPPCPPLGGERVLIFIYKLIN